MAAYVLTLPISVPTALNADVAADAADAGIFLAYLIPGGCAMLIFSYHQLFRRAFAPRGKRKRRNPRLSDEVTDIVQEDYFQDEAGGDGKGKKSLVYRILLWTTERW